MMAEMSREFQQCVRLMVEGALRRLERPDGSRAEVVGNMGIQQAAEDHIKRRIKELQLIGNMTKEQAEAYLLARMAGGKDTA